MKYSLILYGLLMILMIFLLSGFYLFNAKGYSFVGVTPTGSMHPTIKTGDKVIINWNTESFISRNLTGEVIVFSNLSICHRCILDKGEWLTTRGDACTMEEYLTRDEIKGIFIQVSYMPFLEMLQYGFTG